ncbi:MAG: response regulator transcription factor [Candidatus Obscuribacterales bacterium]|nr:response regulator transcription factor [Candidatus Obscuribacterales bacterium]
MPKLLIIDDDTGLTEALKNYLSQHGFLVECTPSAEDALQILSEYSYDALIVDWNLPEMSGELLVKRFREAGDHTPVMFLTGQNNVSTLERGFEVGADDYLTKPFEPRELVARLKGLLKRRANPFQNELRVMDLVLKPELHIMLAGDVEVKLRSKEVALLEFLIRHPNRIFTAQQIMNAVWASDSESSAHSVRTWMGLLRHKLASVGHQDLIKTVAGAGYILEMRD